MAFAAKRRDYYDYDRGENAMFKDTPEKELFVNAVYEEVVNNVVYIEAGVRTNDPEEKNKSGEASIIIE